ncbi:DASH family cryptochrome [Marinobacter sp. M216]|uniref:Cryptochrome DASH n=1 Tax=Marinobacter albus TaxID=3030833 RepID=A0ABT7HFP6_9GAMM|nr:MULTISPECIES: DASH family cryptochrome [unclassified Marinobacter]MBW7472080.1 DASH family cryptochrome [Marinobacter sp. F4218]MDK9558650.1 DASH family cryptochrome [Marinobacter sp. M216]
MNTLYWFTRDLRLHDNAALLAASRSDMLLCVFVVDPRWFSPGQFQSRAMGEHRWRFLWQSLMALERGLRPLGQRLRIAYGKPETVIPELVHAHGIARVVRSRQPGTQEAIQWQSLKEQLPDTLFQQFETLSLFTEGSLPMALPELPDTFSQFRKQVEKTGERCTERLRIRTLTALPPPPGFADDNRGECPPIAKPQHPLQFIGGEEAGLEQLRQFLFVRHGIDNYKETRNALDTWDASSKFSPWLANGSLSVREVAETIAEYERSDTKNESTYWLWFELLWREYFHWYALKHRASLFRRDGVQRKRRPATFYGHRFMAWCQGNTEYPLVNAAMNQLRETGYMSNRARQLVASCFVNELELDWRYGAAWFEQQLIDYDVASNYGNWQYLAGVGADPRGLRQFNLEKQAKQYDPLGTFVDRWGGHADQPVGLHTVDAADWPIL